MCCPPPTVARSSAQGAKPRPRPPTSNRATAKASREVSPYALRACAARDATMRCRPCGAGHAVQAMRCRPCGAGHAVQAMRCRPCGAGHRALPSVLRQRAGSVTRAVRPWWSAGHAPGRSRHHRLLPAGSTSALPISSSPVQWLFGSGDLPYRPGSLGRRLGPAGPLGRRYSRFKVRAPSRWHSSRGDLRSPPAQRPATAPSVADGCSLALIRCPVLRGDGPGLIR
jgi:hypothetical protein